MHPDPNAIYSKYEKLFDSLLDIIHLSENRVIDDSDALFGENVNFFVKSYLISICSYLEAYIQELAFEHANSITSRLTTANVPFNFIYWRVAPEVKEKELKYELAELPVKKDEIADALSANPYKTIRLFRLLGLDIDKEESFQAHKELVFSIVNKRNSIVHHNDTAADVSFSDLVVAIGAVKKYMSSFVQIINDSNSGT